MKPATVELPIQTWRTDRTPEDRARRRHLRDIRLSQGPAIIKPHATLFERALRHVFSWDYRNYPGLQRGSVQLFSRQVAYRSVRAWREGTRSLPSWARDILADAIEARCRAGLELVAELRALPCAERRVPSGVCVVDPVTKMDGRPRTGRKVKDRRGAKTETRSIDPPNSTPVDDGRNYPMDGAGTGSGPSDGEPSA